MSSRAAGCPRTRRSGGECVKLFEYQAKALFSKHGIPTARRCVVRDPGQAEEAVAAAGLRYPVVVKAQVQTGGRGKAGGILFAENPAQAKACCARLLGSSILGHEVRRLLIEEKISAAAEWYLSIVLDRARKCPMIIFSSRGGVDIEATVKEEPEAVRKIAVDPLLGVGAYMARYLASSCGLPGNCLEQLDALLRGLFGAFGACDALLMEINPVVVDSLGNLTALDGKVEIDDSALGRQPDILRFREEIPEEALVREARGYNFLYIPIDGEGTVGVISNGSGMLMSCIDMIAGEGLKVCAGLDLGGGATADRICEALRIMFSTPGIRGALINIFGGITRCDEVAGGVKQAVEKYGLDGRVIIIRMEGTNKEQGVMIIRSLKGNITLVDGLRESMLALKEARQSL